MIEIDQTTFGFPDQPDSTPGNCLSACVASYLELSLSEVPTFAASTEQEAQLNEWLLERGLYAISFRCDPEQGDIVPIDYHLLSGQSPRRPDRRDMLHGVVARGREIVWDPHPSRAGLLNWQITTILVPRDLSAWRWKL